jgi:redox-sensitive bicupin YhaK (pirin superfamily)
MLSIPPREKDLGGFTVRRLLPFHKQRMVGPFIFFDHLGPASFDAGEGIDVRPHPHIGLATVTYLFDGEIIHRDSLGNDLAITPGAINLMVAGKGIVHSERTAEERRKAPHSIHALQLWLALPEAEQEREPEFSHYPADTLPPHQLPQATIRVMIGEAFGITSPVKTFSETLYVEVKLEAGGEITLPDSPELAIYMVQGEATVENNALNEHHLTTVSSDDRISSEQGCHFVIIGGDPLGKRYIWWNLVSTSEERIEAAKQQWKEDKFPKVPGETEFIPLPE